MGQLLLGALLGFAGAVLVQTFVVPRVQAGTRRRDRWERDVIELAVLVEEELSDLFSEYRWAAERMDTVAQFKDVDQGQLKIILANLASEANAKHTIAREATVRIERAQRWLKLVRPQSPYWPVL